MSPIATPPWPARPICGPPPVAGLLRGDHPDQRLLDRVRPAHIACSSRGPGALQIAATFALVFGVGPAGLGAAGAGAAISFAGLVGVACSCGSPRAGRGAGFRWPRARRRRRRRRRDRLADQPAAGCCSWA